MGDLKYRGIIIKQANYGEGNRMLWIFTETDGIVKAVRYGVRGKKSANAAAFQLFSYADFTLRESNSEIMTASGADVIDSFYPISEDIKKLALCVYLADIAYGMLGERNPDTRILSLLLNAVYALSSRNEPLFKVKCAYEIKLICAGGYMPNLSGCAICGREGGYFSAQKGCLVCREHHTADDIKISQAAAAVMNYLISCEDKKMLSFSAKDETVFDEVSRISEKYISVQCDRVSSALSYFYSIIGT